MECQRIAMCSDMSVLALIKQLSSHQGTKLSVYNEANTVDSDIYHSPPYDGLIIRLFKQDQLLKRRPTIK